MLFLAQSLARDFGPKGIHVSYVTIDASINTPWTRSRIEHQNILFEMEFAQPEDIAEEIFRKKFVPKQKMKLLLCYREL